MYSPTFSIITITYNASRWLEDTILSILNQSYPHIEYIIIDGASTDGTVDIIRKYASKISYWISEPDKGLYDAMNKGLQAATGDYVWFINAGDKLNATDIVQQIVEQIERLSELPDIIYGETSVVDENGELLGMRRLSTPEKLTWKSFRMGMLVCHQSFISKRTIAPLYDLKYRYSSDFDWCIRCMKKAETIYNTHLTLSNFLDGGLTTQQRKTSLKERYAIMSHYYGKITTSLLHLWFAVRFYYAKWIKGRV
ncbi:glycosyltransferase [Parabacteroides sp. OttesenSCG-928-G07]|nr:glycosyltransferase [Parabacteroides sp. OttesenSCG-928-G21]MDL2277815.1 glycosyltransferase [Parabacteroides sp. OttesenSCG-928-G07]